MLDKNLDNKIQFIFFWFERTNKRFNNTPNTSAISNDIVRMVSSELIVRSKTLITDMYSEMSKETLSKSEFVDPEYKEHVLSTNLRSELLDKGLMFQQ